jgi:hypothetical protein
MQLWQIHYLQLWISRRMRREETARVSSSLHTLPCGNPGDSPHDPAYRSVRSPCRDFCGGWRPGSAALPKAVGIRLLLVAIEKTWSVHGNLGMVIITYQMALVANPQV